MITRWLRWLSMTPPCEQRSHRSLTPPAFDDHMKRLLIHNMLPLSVDRRFVFCFFLQKPDPAPLKRPRQKSLVGTLLGNTTSMADPDCPLSKHGPVSNQSCNYTALEPTDPQLPRQEQIVVPNAPSSGLFRNSVIYPNLT